MNILTRKSLLLCLALTPAHSALAAGWFSGYIPTWIATPVSAVYNYMYPYAPATKSDAQAIKNGLEKESTAAHLLQKATQEDLRKATSKFHAIDEDLLWIARKTEALDEKQEGLFAKQRDSLIALNDAQEAHENAFADNIVEVTGLKKQLAKAIATMKSTTDTLSESNQSLSNKIAIVQEIALKSHEQQIVHANEQFALRDAEYKKAEQQLSSMNGKIQAVQESLYKYFEQVREDAIEKTALVDHLKRVQTALQKQYERKKAKKERSRNGSNALAQAASASTGHKIQTITNI